MISWLNKKFLSRKFGQFAYIFSYMASFATISVGIVSSISCRQATHKLKAGLKQSLWVAAISSPCFSGSTQFFSAHCLLHSHRESLFWVFLDWGKNADSLIKKKTKKKQAPSTLFKTAHTLQSEPLQTQTSTELTVV